MRMRNSYHIRFKSHLWPTALLRLSSLFLLFTLAVRASAIYESGEVTKICDVATGGVFILNEGEKSFCTGAITPVTINGTEYPCTAPYGYTYDYSSPSGYGWRNCFYYASLLNEGVNTVDWLTATDQSPRRDYLLTTGCDYMTTGTKTFLTHKDLVLVVPNSLDADVAYWEISRNGGVSWDRIEEAAPVYTTSEATEGTVLYRNVSTAGTYSDIITVQYIDAVPTEVKASVDNNVKTVDEAVTFTLDVPDRGYAYQWFKDGVAIDGATQNTYTIDAIKTRDAGSYTCRVSNACSESTSVPATLSVNRCPQVINFPELQTVTYGCAPIDLPATTNKGLDVTYQSSNTAVATISGHTLTVVGPGEANIIASQAGDDDYLAATTVTRTLRVNKIAQTISFDAPPRKTFGDLPFALPEKSSEGLTLTYRVINTEVATVSGNVVTIVGAGSTEIIASQEGDALHYAAAPVTQTLTVDKAAQTITFQPLTPRRYGDPPVTLNEVTDKGLPITYTVADTTVARIDGNIVTLQGVGQTAITATQAGTANFLPAEAATQTLTVTRGTQTIALGHIDNKTFGDPDFELPATTDKGLPVSYSSSDTTVARLNGHRVHITGVGTTQITATQAGNSLYEPAASITLPFTVSRAYQEITFTPLPACTYGDGSIELNAQSNSGVPIRFVSSDTTVARIAGHRALIVGAGRCTLTAYAESSDNWFDATPVAQELTVNKATQTISFGPLEDCTYGDNPVRLAATATSGLDVTFRSSASSVILIEGQTARIVGAGDVTITATQAGDKNYLSASATATLHVNKAPLTVKPDNATRLYGDDNPELTLSYEGFKNGDTEFDLDQRPRTSTDARRDSPVGAYDISATAVTDHRYTITSLRGTLTVEKAPLTVRADDARRTYGEANPTLDYTCEGLKLGQTASTALSVKPAVTTTARTSSPAGTYPIQASGAEATNYAITYAPGTLTVDKATLNVWIDNETVEYGDQPELLPQYSGWKLNDDEDDLDFPPRVVTQATIASYPGRYPLTLEGGLDDNYAFSLSTASRYLTIEKAPLDVYAPDTAKVYGTPNPDFVLTYVGFKNGETADDLERRPTATCSATESSWYGEYTIYLSGGYDSRYTFNLHNGSLAITRPTGISATPADDSDIRLSSRDGILVVQSPHGLDVIEVFDASGRRLTRREHLPAGETRIEVGTPGACVVRTVRSGKVHAEKIYIH